MATVPRPCATPRRACRASPVCCSTRSTKARSTSCPTTTAAPRSRASCPPGCHLRCSTAPAALPWAWPPKSPPTTNPKIKAGKKALSQEQTQLKASLLAVLDLVRDESGKDAPVRLVFEPKTGKTPQQELITALLAHTSLETSAPINLTLVGLDGRPVQKSLRQMLQEWIAFRQTTITRRSQHHLNKVLERIHILEGRQIVLLHLDEVIAIIPHPHQPKAALMARWSLSDRQAEDILEIRLRQLARLEALRIGQELQELRDRQGKLEDILKR